MDEQLAGMQKYYQMISDFLVEYSFQLLGALVILFVGLWLAKKVANGINQLCINHDVDITLANFLANLARVSIIVLVAVMALSQVGIAITPFVAAIGAASLGAGLAFQGMLSNYAAGITIILTRLINIGNTVRIQGVYGVVKQINLGYTLLENEDGETILLPNKSVVGEVLHNSKTTRVVEGEIGVAYNSDMDQALAVVTEAVLSMQSEAPVIEPKVGIDRFDDSAIVIGYRVWVPSLSYFESKYAINRAVFHAIMAAEIEIPFPQRVVHTAETTE